MPVYTYPINTTGVAGSATGEVTTAFDFPAIVIDCIKVDYNAAAPATTDLTVEETEGLQRTILTLSDQNTDVEKYPRHATHNPDGTSGSMADYYVARGPLKISVAGCDALSPAVTVVVSGWIGEAMR